MKAVHARLKGFTASVRVPFLVSGTQLASPLPYYSTLLGLLGSCAGRTLSYDEARIGFTYTHEGETVDPVERLLRLGVDPNNGVLSRIKERGVGQRSFHVMPTLDLYVVSSIAQEWLLNPIGIPCLGRSQDIMWIDDVTEVELTPVEYGNIHGTWLPFGPGCPSGRILRFVEYYRNDIYHTVRVPGPSGIFVAMPSEPPGVKVELSNLYHSSDAINDDDVIYLHEWTVA